MDTDIYYWGNYFHKNQNKYRWYFNEINISWTIVSDIYMEKQYYTVGDLSCPNFDQMFQIILFGKCKYIFVVSPRLLKFPVCLRRMCGLFLSGIKIQNSPQTILCWSSRELVVKKHQFHRMTHRLLYNIIKYFDVLCVCVCENKYR